MIILILLVLGLCLGSFVNAFVWRHYQREFAPLEREAAGPKKEIKKTPSKQELTAEQLSIVRGRSMCTHCYHELAARDLIPVVSYLWLRGKCRYCGRPIQDSPLAELLTPLLFVVSYVFWPAALQGEGLVLFILWLVFLTGFVALIVYDLRWFLLPHSIVVPLIGLALLQVILEATVFGGGLTVLLRAFWGALVIGGLFFALHRISNEKWIGGGDITLGILLGLLVGGPANALLLVFIASLLGTLVAIPLLALLRKPIRTTHLPFGPFLILAGVIVMLFGKQTIDWYTAHFLVF